MKKLTIDQLKDMLLNEEMIFTFLDNTMYNNGYYTVFNDGVTKDIKNDLNVVYTAMDTCEAEVQIFFEIIIDNEPDEVEESFYLKVIDIQEF